MNDTKPEPEKGPDPETRREAEEETTRDFRLTPGGRHGSTEPIGMSALDRDDVPSEGRDLGLVKYGDSPPGND
jgi:hypothetical protein